MKDFLEGKWDHTFMMLVVALSDGPGEYNRREALRKYAITNYVEKVAPEYSKEGPPPEAYRDSEKLYEARLKRLKPKVNLILMGDGYNHWAIRVTENVSKEITILTTTTHPSNFRGIEELRREIEKFKKLAN